MKIIIGVSGASGVQYAIELLKACSQLEVETHLVISEWAVKNFEIEMDYTEKNVRQYATFSHDNMNLAAPISSGSFQHDGMVIIPCSMKSIASLAIGYSDSLLIRAADVTIKEGRKLVVVPRETPLSAIHLENMLKLARLNVTILPPMPAMYIKPYTIDDLIKHTVGRVLDQFGISNSLVKRWS